MSHKVMFRTLSIATIVAALIVALGACTPTEDTVTASPTVTASNAPGYVDPAESTEEPAEQETTEAPAEPTYTAAQEQAIGSAEDYLSFDAFSKKGLIDQLSSEYGEGFDKADARFAVNHIDVNWNEQAAKSAKDYLSFDHFSRQGLIDQLESAYGEQFTHAQAVYGVNAAGL